MIHISAVGLRRKRMAAIAIAMIVGAGASAEAAAPALPSVGALPRHAAALEGFVPRGWKLVAKPAGDLNGDGRADVLLVLHDADPRNVTYRADFNRNFDANPYILAVVFASPAGGYDLGLENRTFIPRPAQPDDDLQFTGRDAEIRHGAFKITFEELRGHTDFTFRWQNGRFALIGFDTAGVSDMAGDSESTSIDFSTGRVKLETGNISAEGPGKVVWKTLKPAAPPSIDTIGDGTMFDYTSLFD